MSGETRQVSLLPALFPELPPEEKLVWAALQSHQGRENAVTGETLCHATGLAWRVCRQAMKNLVEVYRKRIGSVPGSPPGYFLIQTVEELDDVCERYRGQALSLLHREAVLRRIGLAELLGQMELHARKGAENGHTEST